MTALGAWNLGDELIAWCEYRCMREHFPETQIFVYNYEDSNGLFLQLSKKDKSVHMRSYFPSNICKYPFRNIRALWKMIFDIATSDLLIIGGGGLWYDNELGQNPHIQRLQWMLRVWIAKAFRTSILFWWIGIDVDKKHIAKYRSIFSGSNTQIIVRDHHSHDLLEKIWISSIISTDSVIALSRYFEELFTQNKSKSSGKFHIGISVRSGYHHDEIDILKNVVKQLREKYSNCVIYGLSYSHREGNPIISDTTLLKLLNLDQIITDHAEIIKLLPTLDIMIATRLHAMITARLLNTPTLCLSYARKTREVFVTLNDRWYWYGIITDIQTLNHENINNLLIEFEKGRNNFWQTKHKIQRENLTDEKTILNWISQKNPS